MAKADRDTSKGRCALFFIAAFLLIFLRPTAVSADRTAGEHGCWNAWEARLWHRVITVCSNDAAKQEQNAAGMSNLLQGEETLPEAPDSGPDTNIPLFQNQAYADFFICGAEFARVAYALYRVSPRSPLVMRSIGLADRAFRFADDPAITSSGARIAEVERVRDLLSDPARFFSRTPDDLGMISEDVSYLDDYR